jgi:hypothetical protein
MSSLLRSIGLKWKRSEALCQLIPFGRVFTGRVPSTELYKFPYVSILSAQGSQTHRTDKSRYSHGPLSFHIWVDDAALEDALTVAEAISAEYADKCWSLGEGANVIDVLDEGEPMAHQTDLPNIKAWEVVKLFIVCIERLRTGTPVCCGSPSSSSGGFSSSSEHVSSSSDSSSSPSHSE